MSTSSAPPDADGDDAAHRARLVQSINEAWDARDALVDLLGGDKTQALRDQFVRLGEIRWHLEQASQYAQPCGSNPHYTSVARALERRAKKPTMAARGSEQGLTECIREQLARMLKTAREARDAIVAPAYGTEPSFKTVPGDAKNKIKKHLDSAVFHMQRLIEAAELLVEPDHERNIG